MLEKLFAAIVVAVCAVLLLRMVFGPGARERFDDALRRGWAKTSRWTRQTVAQPAAEHRAKRAAEEAIRRASRGSWDGNVFKPDSFGKKRGDKKPDRRRDLH